MTSAILSEKKTLIQKWAPVAATVAASLPLSQGMNAVNVQFDSVQIQPIIAANDLSSVNRESFSFNVTNVTRSSSIDGIPSTDTILRSAIRSTASDQRSTCTWITDQIDPPEASIRFGFSLNSWLEFLLPTSLKSDMIFKFSINDEITDSSAHSISTNWALDDMAQLFSYGVSIALTHYSDEYDITLDFTNDTGFASDKLVQRINTSNAWQTLSDMQREIVNSSSNWTNISVSEMNIEFSSFQLSPQMQFDAVTFELPVDMATMQQWMQDLSGVYLNFEHIRQ